MRRKLTAFTLVLALVSMATLAPMAATAATPGTAAPAAVAAGFTIPITTALTNGATGTFSGNFNLTRFVVKNGQLFAVGTLAGTVKDAAGNILGTVLKTITLLVSNVNGTCDILHLELGPLDLDLLGLQIHLDKIVLDITAQSGPGNLLGNLLCAVANLLNGGLSGILGQLANLLNQILGQL